MLFVGMLLSSTFLAVRLMASSGAYSSSALQSRQDPPPQQTNSFSPSEALLGAGALWAANNGTKVAYVDLYDNLLAYPNPYLPTADYYLPLKNEAVSVLTSEDFAVDTFATIPDNLSQYSLVYLEAYLACEPVNEPAIRIYISSGGGVLMWQGSICYVAYYSKTWNTGQDLSDVADWFGASYFINTGGDAYVSVPYPLGTNLTSGEQLVTDVGHSDAGIRSVSTGSQVLATWFDGSTFAFIHQYGQGRVYWQATQFPATAPQNPPIQNPPPQQPPPQKTQVYYSAESVAIDPLIDVNASINGLEIPYPPSALGQNFTVEIHLRNATDANVPAGVYGVEAHFDFGNILNYCNPIGFTTMLGQSGGALVGPLIYVLNGFYDANGNPINTASYAHATQYAVAAATTAGVGWKNDDGLVAQITFQITGQPSQVLNQSDFYAQLRITFADLTGNSGQEIPVSVVQGTLQIDASSSLAPALNGDFKVGLTQLVILTNAYGSHCANYHYQGEPTSPNWNPNADVNDDGIVNLADLVIMANHYGQHHP